MKALLATLVVLCALRGSPHLEAASAEDRESRWKAVEAATSKGLPQTAITNLQWIISAALKEKAYPEAVKAIAQKIALEGNIQGNKAEERITRLEAEIPKLPKEAAPVLQALLADWYWYYFQQNRWRFMQRTATAETPGADFTTWDLPRLFAEIDKHFQKALSESAVIRKTPVSAWDALLVKGTMPDAYRPTLYDFIAHEALEFYTSGEQAAARPQGAFEVAAGSPALGSAEQFLAWRPWENAQDTNSPVLRAVRVYQDLLRFHAQDPEPAPAFAHVDLERLSWAWNIAYGEEKNSRYKQALEEFVKRHADSEISAIAMERHARVLQQEGDLAGARELALRGSEVFPETPGGMLCFNLVKEIERKSVSLVTEKVWNAPWPKITIRYRNITNIYFRAVPFNWDRFVEGRNRRIGYLNQEQRAELLKIQPVLEWQEPLSSTTNYQERVFAANAPSTLAKGFYFIIASGTPDFRQQDNQIAMADVWVSDLALVTRQRNGKVEGFVLKAASGEPIQGAEIEPWGWDQEGRRFRAPELRTDANGFFEMQKTAARPAWTIRVRVNKDELATSEDLWASGTPQKGFIGSRTLFFTDRSLYRPGQTVQYKGLVVSINQEQDNYSVETNREVTVVFHDPNGKEIARQKHRANAFGSFSGSFVAPRDRLMGIMRIFTEENDGSTNIRVEEYKRPKFEVELNLPKEATRLSEKVALTGKATAYTGAAIDGANVSYRVVREVRMPWWWGWRFRGGHQGQSQEIAHGTTSTDVDGTFKVEFEAKPDPKVSPKNEPTFEFHVHVDVTDTAGETRSDDQSIRLGYTALEAMMTANPWQTTQTPVEVKVITRTLDGEPQVAEGSVKLHALISPQTVHRTPIGGPDADLDGWPDDDLSATDKWPLGEVIAEEGFTTDTNGIARIRFKLPPGAYRAVLETRDRFGKAVTGLLPIQVLDPEADKLNIKVPHLVMAPRWEVQPGEKFMALWGTGYREGRAFIEIERRHEMVKRYWTSPGRTQEQIQLAVDESFRGGFTLHVTQVRENRSYIQSYHVAVPWKNKELAIQWEHFVSKLQPGKQETWTAVITRPAEPAQKSARPKIDLKLVEMVAALYDESLDAFASHLWPVNSGLFAINHSDLNSSFANGPEGFQHVLTHWDSPRKHVEITYRRFPAELQERLWSFGWFSRRSRLGGAMETAAPQAFYAADSVVAETASVPASAGATLTTLNAAKAVTRFGTSAARELSAAKSEPTENAAANLGTVAARKNLNETAFFFPHLTADSNGVVRMTFTMPEALTRWKFIGFAHDRQLRQGYLEGHAVTAKDLMVQPNPPRFLREGDEIEFTVKVSNQSETPQTGTARLTFSLAATEENADKLLGNNKTDQGFDIPARESRTFSWRIRVPDGCGFLAYKAVAATDKVSDGEEGAIPVLSRRIFVTESLPLPIRGPGTKEFEFTKLLQSAGSKTLRHENLTVQMVSNPAWYAVLALPYLMEYPHECSEQVFNRLYANCLARDIANRDPKIRQIFDLWKNTPALESPLEKNQDLKSVMIEETPWLRQALAEGQSRKNVGILFDDNRLSAETDRTMQKLREMQIGNGQWPWFPGGPGDDYITLYITTGFGRMRHLGVDIDVTAAVRALASLDDWMAEEHREILRRSHPEEYVPSPRIALYLYGRSFFLQDRPVGDAHQKAIQFFLERAREHWLKTGNRQSQGHLALALHRFARQSKMEDPTPKAILASLRERSVSNEEMGMFWRDLEFSWWWFHAPIETQALMIEAFDEIAQDSKAVEDCKVWLLKQKQTQDWKTTKATADAVYALLLRGRDLLASDALVRMKVGNMEIQPRHGGPTFESQRGENRLRPVVEPGTGFYEVKFSGPEIKPRLGEIRVTKTDKGVAWGSVHWQYFEDISKITPHEGTPLKLTKSLYVKKATASGPILEAVKGPVQVGDELVVRIELRTDRDMEYVHMKDQRGSGTEPVNVLSRYKYQDGLGYYESTRDTASHFFISYLPKGVYVFEYSTRVQLRGQYQTGMAEIQCMYAPEFNSHSQSIPLKVQ